MHCSAKHKRAAVQHTDPQTRSHCQGPARSSSTRPVGPTLRPLRQGTLLRQPPCPSQRPRLRNRSHSSDTRWCRSRRWPSPTAHVLQALHGRRGQVVQHRLRLNPAGGTVPGCGRSMPPTWPHVTRMSLTRVVRVCPRRLHGHRVVVVRISLVVVRDLPVPLVGVCWVLCAAATATHKCIHEDKTLCKSKRTHAHKTNLRPP